MTYDQNCGKIIGVNEILYVCDRKANDGHKLYHTRCIVCGFEADKRLGNIKKYTTCHQHKVITQNGKTEYSDLTAKWKCQDLRDVFSEMKQRCYNPNSKNYNQYGARGISVCEKWEKDPIKFETWALENGYRKGLTIDRIEHDKGYFPENCRFITNEENARFKRGTNDITINGMRKSGRQWAEYLGMGTNEINKMIRKKGKSETIAFIQSKLENKTL